MIDIYIQIEHYGKMWSIKDSVHFFVTYLERISIWWCIIQYIIKEKNMICSFNQSVFEPAIIWFVQNIARISDVINVKY